MANLHVTMLFVALALWAAASPMARAADAVTTAARPEAPVASLKPTAAATDPIVPQTALPLEPPKPPATQANERPGYILQFGAFSEPDAALRMQANLKKAGYAAVLRPISAGGKTFQLLRLDGFADRDSASRTAASLQHQTGIGSLVMKATEK